MDCWVMEIIQHHEKRFKRYLQGALVNKGNEPSGFIKLRAFLDYLRAY